MGGEAPWAIDGMHNICYSEGVAQEEFQCRACGLAVVGGDFKKKLAVLIQNEAYCRDCVGQGALRCDTCEAGLRSADFQEGRAVVLLGRRYCPRCLDMAVIHGKLQRREGQGSNGALQPPPEAPTTRMSERFVPPPEGRLELRPAGLRGLFCRNIVLKWLDVSAGGIRARVKGAHEREEILKGRISHASAGRSFAITTVIRFVEAAGKDLGGPVVGCAFLRPSSELQAFIGEHLSRDPVLSSAGFRKDGSGSRVAPVDPPGLRKNA